MDFQTPYIHTHTHTQSGAMWPLVLLNAGSIFFFGLFLFFKWTLSCMMGWSGGDAEVLSARLVSSLQAVMASSAGFIVTSSCSDVMKDRHWLTDSYVLFATPYFAYDIYAMYRCHRHKLRVKGHDEEEEAWPVVLLGFLRRERLLVLHHIFMVGVCCPASLLWRQGTGDYFQGVLFLAELSTPSVCLSKVLIQFNKQKSLLHKVNGLVLMVTFFCCRVLLFPYLYYSYSRYVSVSLLTVPLLVPWQCNLGAAVLWSLQLYWFSLILRGGLRLLTTASHASSHE